VLLVLRRCGGDQLTMAGITRCASRTNAKMHAIQVQDSPVFLKRTLAPGFKLVSERLVEATDCVGAVAIPLAFGTPFSPGHSDEGISLFAHHGFSHRPNGTLSKDA
jgi:hypothetical protein